ncbi:50S ribosome-binding GTPase [Nocardioides carbamazepini]|uniref:GTPase n=1 Tax=Nocardioides carbamazepini TaxID=2854259 RepID=UPI002149E970|nr:GTPase [Nocardioides carbamazepini]MCR1782012.1 50S ribosome-binding GTPase [Nocardioides carbamazepini]
MNLQARIEGLRTAADAAEGRLDQALLDDIRAGADRSSGRLRLSERHTVVAIAGATGSGKSTLFNALAGAEISTSGARRPTTATAQALVRGDDDPDEMLTWLGIRAADRHRHGSPASPARLPEGLVLLDLPDHDSIEAAHHEEARRVVELADVLVWVVDPQKYADAAIHREFLQPLAGHRAVTMVVLNHIDTVPEDRRRSMLADLRKLLVADGIRDPRILATSARHGTGIDDLRRAITRRVQEKQNTVLRIDADIRSAVARLEEAAGRAPYPVPDVWVADLERRVADAAGRPPARRGPVDRPTVDNAVRGLVDRLCRDLAPGWGRAVRTAVTQRLGDTDDRLDAELAALPAPAARPMRIGARGVVALAAVLMAVAVAASWATGVLPPTVALVAGGLLVAAVTGAGVLTRRAAPRGAARADQVDDGCREVVTRVVREHVLAPARRELASYARFERGLRTARG